MAQGPLDSLERRIASLDTAIVIQRTKLRDAVADVERRIIFTDSVTIGPLHARTTRELLPIVDATLREAWSRLSPVTSEALAQRLNRRRYHFYIDTMQWWPPRRDFVSRVDDMDAIWRSGRALTSSSSPSEVALAFVLGDADLEATSLFTPEQRERLGGFGDLILLPLSPDELKRTYWGLATDASPAVRNCAAGLLDSCREAFGDRLPPRDRLASWWIPEQYPQLLERIGWEKTVLVLGRKGTNAAGLWNACTVKKQASACTEIMSVLPAELIPEPLGGHRRAMLVNEVLRRGGPDALTRLTTDSTHDVATVFAEAAGVPFDTVLASWQRRILEARQSDAPVSASTALLILAVTAALMIAAACGRIR